MKGHLLVMQASGLFLCSHCGYSYAQESEILETCETIQLVALRRQLIHIERRLDRLTELCEHPLIMVQTERSSD